MIETWYTLHFSFSPIFNIEMGTVRPGQMYHQAAAAYSSLYFFIFHSPIFNIKICVTLFSGTVRPRRLKLGTHVDSGQIFHQNQAAAAYLSLYFFIFILSNFQH